MLLTSCSSFRPPTVSFWLCLFIWTLLVLVHWIFHLHFCNIKKPLSCSYLKHFCSSFTHPLFASSYHMVVFLTGFFSNRFRAPVVACVALHTILYGWLIFVCRPFIFTTLSEALLSSYLQKDCSISSLPWVRERSFWSAEYLNVSFKRDLPNSNYVVVSPFCKISVSSSSLVQNPFVIMHLSMLSPREGTPGICGSLDFSGEFLVKIHHGAPKFGQIRSNIPTLGK